MMLLTGTIGTGLFLGTGRSLAQGGPASMLICYSVVGFIVYITLLLLGEMATQYPVAGSFNAYTTRFFSPSYGFALGWNYWFNDAVSVASDLTAAQLVMQYWSISNSWIVSLVFWIFLVSVNATHVRAYGELEYWLSSLKVVTVVIFIIVGILVNVGVNTEHRFIGLKNWQIPGAPFVGGFGGFARVFVTASFAFGGTESLGITAGETLNPSKNMPRVVKLIMIFYFRGIIQLSNGGATTSPFTLVFREAGSTAAASIINTVVLTSVLSAGNHALFAGTRVLYGLSTTVPPQAPAVFSWTTKQGIPVPALFLTSSISALCLGSSYIGSGTLWGWLQNIVGVSNQIAWVSIGLSSWRFRKAWLRQGRSPDDLKFYVRWTWPWGPPFVVFSVTFLILIQGWSSVIPTFSLADFISFYIEVPIMIIMTIIWIVIKNKRSQPIHLPDDLARDIDAKRALWKGDLVDVNTVNLSIDEYMEEEVDKLDDEQRRERITGKAALLWRVYYWVV
ncbi:amino acid permease/ SLC12A domain-containing protein [Cyathus striatus]|nr:amino acid permease/ SLC12A domain-containing protein [Cyathus striatus]